MAEGICARVKADLSSLASPLRRPCASFRLCHLVALQDLTPSEPFEALDPVADAERPKRAC
jgi:hypothetical protein